MFVFSESIVPSVLPPHFSNRLYELLVVNGSCQVKRGEDGDGFLFVGFNSRSYEGSGECVNDTLVNGKMMK